MRAEAADEIVRRPRTAEQKQDVVAKDQRDRTERTHQARFGDAPSVGRYGLLLGLHLTERTCTRIRTRKPRDMMASKQTLLPTFFVDTTTVLLVVSAKLFHRLKPAFLRTVNTQARAGRQRHGEQKHEQQRKQDRARADRPLLAGCTGRIGSAPERVVQAVDSVRQQRILARTVQFIRRRTKE